MTILDCLMIVHEHLFFECALTFYTAAMISDQIVKGDAKKMSQTLFTITTFRLIFEHFWLICQKIDTLNFLMSYCRPL